MLARLLEHPVNPLFQILGKDFPELFKDIPKPDPIAADEASEGVCAMGEVGCED